MNAKSFVEELENMLEVQPGSLSMETNVKAHERWDSLAFVSFLAIADSTFGVRVAPDDLREAQTVADLFDLVKKA